jgi:hypothetical protein
MNKHYISDVYEDRKTITEENPDIDGDWSPVVTRLVVLAVFLFLCLVGYAVVF